MRRALEEIRWVIPKIRDHVARRMEEFSELGRTGRTRFDLRPFLDLVLEVERARRVDTRKSGPVSPQEDHG